MTLPTLVVFPVLLITTLFVFQAAVWMYQRQRAEAAAQRGAVAASVVPPGDRRLSPGGAARGAEADAEAAALAWFGDDPPDDLEADTDISGDENDIVTVTVTFSVPSLLGDLDIKASAARQVEVFRPAPPGIGD